MDATEFTDLTAQVAAELGTLRHETWTVTESGADTYAMLASGIARLSLNWITRDSRLSVGGLGPDGHRFRKWHITVDPARGTPAIAKDINRRILGAGYVDDLLVARAKKAERDQQAAERAQWISQAAALFELGMPEDGEKLYLGRFVAGSGYVQAHGVSDTDHLDINLSGIPASVALAMLAVLAGSGAVSALCCFTYGPGHPPQFTSVGCLGEEPERGRDASRARVSSLLFAHGANFIEIEQALSEAEGGRYQVSVIERGDQVLAVVSWDHEGCGEFTVELTRAAREAGKVRTS